jgi:hypothetical protein
LQAPTASQVFVPLQKLSSPFVTSVVQVPFTLAQLRHAVVQVSTQQKPSMQLPLTHSEPATQV